MYIYEIKIIVRISGKRTISIVTFKKLILKRFNCTQQAGLVVLKYRVKKIEIKEVQF